MLHTVRILATYLLSFTALLFAVLPCGVQLARSQDAGAAPAANAPTPDTAPAPATNETPPSDRPKPAVPGTSSQDSTGQATSGAQGASLPASPEAQSFHLPPVSVKQRKAATPPVKKQVKAKAGGQGTSTAAGSHGTPAASTEIEAIEGVSTVPNPGSWTPGRSLDIDYQATDASTATKTETPIMQTPASVEVVPRALIEDRKAETLSEALDTVSGVFATPSGGVFNQFIIRGFEDSVVYRNGLRPGPSGIAFGTDFDMANIQSIEVLKGPASVLYGRGEPGGVINITTKKPWAVPYHSLEQDFGSYNFYRTVFDTTGPVSADGKVLYRFAGAYQDNDSFRDFHTNEQYDLAPSITLRPNSGTDLTFDFEVFNRDFQFDYGIPLPPGARQPDGRIPISRSFQNPNDPIDNLFNFYAGTYLTQRVTDQIKLHANFLYRRNDQGNIDLYPGGFGYCGGSDSTLCRGLVDQAYGENSFAASSYLVGKYKLASWAEHEPLLGVDYSNVRGRYRVAQYDTSEDLSIDIFDPVYNLPRSVYSDHTNVVFSQFSLLEQQDTGVYAQDQITLWKKLHIVGNARFDWATAGYLNSDADGNLAQSYAAAVAPPPGTDEEPSYRAAVLYTINPRLAVYGSWSDSFGHSNNGNPHLTPGELPPETATQYEGGLKAELFNGKVTTTAAVYDLTKYNILTSDPVTLTPGYAGPFYVVPVGAVRARGFEFDMAGQITDKIGVTSSYAYTDSEVIEGTPGDNYPPVVGTAWPNVPLHQVALWLKYDARGYKAQRGWGFGFGMRYIGERQGSQFQDAVDFPGAAFVLPGYTVFDASASYKWKFAPANRSLWTASLNVKNLFNRTYYASAETLSFANCFDARLCVHPGEPLTVLGAIKVDF